MRYATLLLLAACVEPLEIVRPLPVQLTPHVIIDPAQSGLEEQVLRAVSFYQGFGYEIDVGDGEGAIVVQWGWDATVDEHLGVFDGRTITLSDIYPWSFDNGLCVGAYSVTGALLHEIGHALGFPHVAYRQDIMYPGMGPCVIKKELGQ